MSGTTWSSLVFAQFPSSKRGRLGEPAVALLLFVLVVPDSSLRAEHRCGCATCGRGCPHGHAVADRLDGLSCASAIGPE